MRQYFKSIITLALLSLSVISCNNEFDEDMHYTYPGEVEISTWTAEQGALKNYIVNFTVDENGKDVCDIIEFIPSVGVKNTFSNGKYTYNQKTGFIHVDFEKSPFSQTMGAVAELSYLSDGRTIMAGLFEKTEDGLKPASEFRVYSNDTLSILGDWKVGSAYEVSLNSDQTAVVYVGGKSERGTFIQQGNDAVVTTTSGNTYKFHVNEKRQVVYVENGTETVLTRIVDAKNDWKPICVGVYASWLFGEKENLPLYYSESRHVAKIKNFAYPYSEMSFYWSIGQPTVIHTGSMYDTMYEHIQDGQNLGEVYAMPVALDQQGNTAMFDASKNAFLFGHQYAIPGVGGFGANIDAFIITEVL